MRPKFKLLMIVRSKEREAGATKGFKKVIIWIFVEQDSIGDIKMQRGSRQSIYQVYCCSEGKIPELERQGSLFKKSES